MNRMLEVSAVSGKAACQQSQAHTAELSEHASHQDELDSYDNGEDKHEKRLPLEELLDRPEGFYSARDQQKIETEQHPTSLSSILPASGGQSNFHVVFQLLTKLNEEIMQVSRKVRNFDSRLSELEEKNNFKQDRTKRKLRRRADQINRSFACEVEHCGKVYGSEVSLGLHTKLKHGKAEDIHGSTQQRVDLGTDEAEQADDFQG